MKLSEFRQLLGGNRHKQFLLQLPNYQTVPQSFHITEVRLVTKTFIDCGGRVHTVRTCQLQAWLGPDEEHRLQAGKMADILTLSQSIVPEDFLDLEIEYEDDVISQYPVAGATITDDAVTLPLTINHTDCLAKELCLTPSSNGAACGGGSGCC